MNQSEVSIKISKLDGDISLNLFGHIGKKTYLTEAGPKYIIIVGLLLNSRKNQKWCWNSSRDYREGAWRFPLPARRISLLNRPSNNEPDLAIMGRPPEGLETRNEAIKPTLEGGLDLGIDVGYIRKGMRLLLVEDAF